MDGAHFDRVKAKWINKFWKLLDRNVWVGLGFIKGDERQNTVVQLLGLRLSTEVSEEDFLEFLSTDKALLIVDQLIHVHFHIDEDTAVDALFIEIFDHGN